MLPAQLRISGCAGRLTTLFIPLETLSIFLIDSVALALSPGPDNVFVLTQSALHGHGAGLSVTFGLYSGLLVHTAAVSLGIGAIIQTSAVAVNALKVVGAAYLLYLAWRAFRTGATDIAGTARHRNGTAKTVSAWSGDEHHVPRSQSSSWHSCPSLPIHRGAG